MSTSYEVAGFNVSILNSEILKNSLASAIDEGRTAIYVGAYASLIRTLKSDESYRAALQECDLYIDGKGVEWGLKLLHRVPDAQRTATTDVWLDILRAAADRACEIFIIGGTAEVNESMRLTIESQGFTIAGAADGFGPHLEPGSILRRTIARAESPLVLIGMGAGRQEMLASDIAGERHGKPAYIFTVGGLFDHITGQTRRAPLALQRAGLEWAWRVAQEPRRLLRRYVAGNAAFVLAVSRQYLQQRRSRAAFATPGAHDVHLEVLAGQVAIPAPREAVGPDQSIGLPSAPKHPYSTIATVAVIPQRAGEVAATRSMRLLNEG